MYARATNLGTPPLRPPNVPSVGNWISKPSVYQLTRPDSPTTLSLLDAEPVQSPPWPPRTESPPRRPVASSWQDRNSDVRSTTTTSDVLKPHHALIEMEDLEEVRSPVREESGKAGEQMDARQLSRAMGAEKFFDAFHERCPDGRASVVALQEVLEAAGLSVTVEEVEAAVGKVCPDVDPLSNSILYPHCQEVYLHLHAEQRRLETQTQELAKAGCLARWMASDTDATNILLIVVVSLCALSAFLAAGVAILLLFMDGLDTTNNNLQEDLGVFGDILEVFASQIASQTQQQETATDVTTLSVVLQYIGWFASIEREEKDLLRMATSVSNTIAAWLSTGPEKAFIGLASLAAVLTSTSLSRVGLDQTRAVISGINAGGMTSNYELALARWQNNTNNTAAEYLTTFRYSSQCPKTGCVTNATVMAPMLQALAGGTFAQFVMDYRASSVYAGFTSTNGLGVEVMCSASGYRTKRFNLVSNIMQGWTTDSTNSYEYLVAKVSSPGVGSLMVSPQNCNAACQALLVTPGWPMYNALLGQTGVMQFTNQRGNPAMAAYLPVDGQPLALVVQMELDDIIATVLMATVAMLNRLNSQYPYSSQEFELSIFDVQNGNITTTHMTRYRFASECLNGQCVEAPFVQLAAGNCSTGVLTTTDYRGQAVLVGYSCIADLSAVVSVKIDIDDYEADVLQALLEAVNARTAADTATSAAYLLATPNGGRRAQDVRGFGDFTIQSKAKYPNACVNPNCTWNSVSALNALKDLQDVIQTMDYRNVAVKAAPTRSSALSYGIGLALETDACELLQPMVDTAWKVGVFAVAMVAFSTFVLVLVTKLFLKSMIKAKEEGNQAVEKEKDRFSKLVSSMYPAYVVPQLLEGEKQMVCEVPGAAVFFSDIHEFTSASNAMGSKELLLLMGYVYGVMDHIADRFAVYKVKTIGDAYLAVLGLPGTISANISLDLLRFASCVCQVFGDRFVHPTEGQVLAAMNRAMQWNGRPAKQKHSSIGSVANSALGAPKAAKAPSVAPPSQRSGGSRLGSRTSASVAESVRGAQEKVQCIMSYGLAVGKLVAGVLGGRCPMFDIWGTPVNLASRMQSTGEPGRIQVSEQLYQKVIAVPGQPFSFEEPRSTFCKGFGNVNAYMVRATSEGLSKDLQMQLRLEPRYGAFFFDNILSMAPGQSADASRSLAASHGRAADSPHGAPSPRHAGSKATATPKHTMSPKHRNMSPKQRVMIPNHALPSPRNKSMTPKRLASTLIGAVTPSRIVRGVVPPTDDLSETEGLVVVGP